MGQTVALLGGGVSGTVAANVLRKILPRRHRIVVISSDHTHTFYPSLPLLILGRKLPADITRPLARLRRRGICFLRAEAQALEPDRQVISTSRGPVRYDYLLLAPGAEHHPETVPGMEEGSLNPYDILQAVKIRERIAAMTGGRIVLFIYSLPYPSSTVARHAGLGMWVSA